MLRAKALPRERFRKKYKASGTTATKVAAFSLDRQAIKKIIAARMP
jgi:hypothetical protein